MDTPNIGNSPTATLVVTAQPPLPLTTTSLTIMSNNGTSSTNTNTATRLTLNNKYSYSAPASPASSNNVASTSPVTPTPTPTPNQRNSLAGSPTSNGVSLSASYHAPAINALSALSTPKKHLLDAVRSEALRKLRSPNPNCELQSVRLEHSHEPVNVIKGRYLITARDNYLTNGSNAATAKNAASLFRHRVDLTSSNIKCTDIFTEQEFLCKIVNEPLHKVQRAYFALSQDTEGCQSTIYGHTLIRNVHDIVPFKRDSTYLIIAPTPQPPPAAWSTPTAQEQYNQGLDNWGVYEDLHTYIRNKRRLCETEARALFHQICQTVQVCHRNGIILRDLKLKRFYFIDEARTKLQYESLEGSMILDDVRNDTLSDKIGCPLYTAPELLCPNPTYQGKPADMWSLGVILYTMLVGQYPFYERGNYNLITVIRHCHVQIPSSLSRSVRWLLLALLRKNYAERMTSAQIFISPWLKEQRPFYMYIPVDVVVGDFEDDEESAELSDCELMDAEEEQAHLAGYIASKTANAEDSGTPAAAATVVDVGVQPLDYTSATLCSNDSNASSSPQHATTSSSSSSSNISSVSSSSSMEVEDVEMSSST